MINAAVISALGDGQGGSGALNRLCGEPVVTRLVRTVRRVGAEQVVVAARRGETAWVERLRSVASRCGVSVWLADGSSGGPGQGVDGDRRVLVVEGDYVLDERILRALGHRPEEWVVAFDRRLPTGGGLPVAIRDGRLAEIGAEARQANAWYCGASACPAGEVGNPREWGGEGWAGRLRRQIGSGDVAALDVSTLDAYVPGVRRAVPVLWCRTRTSEDARACKRALLEGAQKGTLDVVAAYVHGPLENWVVCRLAELPVTPNQISVVTTAVGLVVAALLAGGNILPGVLLALVVNVMDGLDGKLARVKGMVSRVGELEHSFDCLYEQAWYAAYAWGVHRLTGGTLPLVLGTVMLVLDAFNRHVSMQYRQVMGVSLSDAGRFDRAFRRFDGRRNIYSVHMVLAVVAGVPVLGSWTMALHAAVTAGVYAVRAVTHLSRADRVPSG